MAGLAGIAGSARNSDSAHRTGKGLLSFIDLDPFGYRLDFE
jgi:hypothetical protein